MANRLNAHEATSFPLLKYDLRSNNASETIPIVFEKQLEKHPYLDKGDMCEPNDGHSVEIL